MIEDQARWAIPSVHVIDDELLKDTWKEPIPPGGTMPDLGLAGSFNVASGIPFQTQPEPIKPEIVWPTLNGSPECGGYDPQNPSPPAPNVAGCGGGYDFPADGQIHQPDFGVPDFASLDASLQPYDLDAGLNYSYGSEFAPDPMNPDLTDYRHPMGLDFHQSSPADIFKPDPVTGDLIDYDVPGGVSVLDYPADPDPQLPDLQHPQLEPDRRMQTRPGDMDTSALDVMHQAATYNQVKGVAYDVSFLTQPGSTRRARHLDGLMHGLDGDL